MLCFLYGGLFTTNNIQKLPGITQLTSFKDQCTKTNYLEMHPDVASSLQNQYLLAVSQEIAMPAASCNKTAMLSETAGIATSCDTARND